MYVDGRCLALHAPHEDEGAKSTLKSLSLKDILLAVENATKSTASSPPNDASRGPLVIIDGLDLVLASVTRQDIASVQNFISSIRAISQSVIISSSADLQLLHSRDDSATPLERDHAAFVATLAHQSSFVLQLRGLHTGSARDVTGVLRLSRGGAYEDLESTNPLPDAEWLYQIKGDGSVRVWSRGE